MKKLSIPFRFGLVTSAVLISYFLILALLNKHTNPTFSFFNAIITAFGIYEAVRLQKLQDVEHFTYSEGFKTAIITGFVASVFFTFFFLLYATEFNSTFTADLLKIIDGGFDATVGLITFIVLIMGLATTVVCALTVMQLFKRSRNIGQNT